MVRIGRNRQVSGIVLPRLPPTPVLPKLPEPALAPRGLYGLDTNFPGTKLEPIPVRPKMYRPKIPRVTIKQAPKRIIVNPRPIIPAPGGPNLPRLPRLPEPEPMQLRVKPVTPPVKGGDMGGPLSSTSPWAGNIGFSSGRTFEEAGKLY